MKRSELLKMFRPRWLVLAGLVLCCGRVSAGENMVTLTQDGKPRARIVVASQPTKAAVLAAMELRDHVKKISGAELPILSASQKVEDGVRILVGDSPATRAMGLRGADFKYQEYLIRVQDRDLILMGRDARQPYGLTVWGLPQPTEGKFGRARLFDGKHDGVILEKHDLDDQQGSLEVWTRTAAQKPGGTILRIDGNPWSYHIVSQNDQGRFVYMTYDGKTSKSVQSEPMPAGWHYLLATWSAAAKRMELFVDGNSVGAAPYNATHCAKSVLGIGVMPVAPDRGHFQGALDEMRLSRTVRAPAGQAAPVRDDDTLALLHFDEPAETPLAVDLPLTNLTLERRNLPGLFDEQATAHAVYHFLERCCGVRWYGPTEICTVYPHAATLTVSVSEVRRTPSFPYRNVMHAWNFTPKIFGPNSSMPTVVGLWAQPTPEDMWRYAYRMRNGGEAVAIGHSLYGYYDRFWRKNPKNERAWEKQHLEWFAHGYEGQPPQMCYNCEGFLKQLVADARAAFDRKTAGAPVISFPVGPMDNCSFCKCPVCLKQAAPEESLKTLHFSNGANSNYIFGFCNKIAQEVRKTHPDKHLTLLTYMSWARHPGFRIEPNIAIHFALAGGANVFIDDPAGVVGRNIWGLYREWVEKERGRPIYLWLYTEFPESPVWSRGYTCFPGFCARLIAKQMKMYYQDGVRGIMPEGISTQLNEYMYNQLAFDVEQDPEQLLGEFFTLYYGAAAAPMRKLWLEIEETYTNPANWPQEFTKTDQDISITEETSWKRLGTTQRMDRWAKYMDEAKTLAKTDAEQARVRLFEQVEWISMVRAKRLYENKERTQRGTGALTGKK